MTAAAITGTPAEDLRWTSSALLVALAARDFKAGHAFTADMAREWVPALSQGRRLKHAIETLTDNQFITSRVFIDKANARTVTEYTLTQVGGEAVKTAKAGHMRASGPKGPHTKDRKVPPAAFAMRLWSLMRARQVLDSDTAASTLVDAGGDCAVAMKTAQRYFANWAKTGAITESKHRLEGNRKRYVLVKDTPEPPAWTPKAKARRVSPPTPTATEE
jgi:hypothetical protein